MARESMTVRIAAETRNALDAIAKALDRDRSYVVNEALSTFIATHRWQAGHIRQGQREAEAGTFVSPAGVKKVLDRLRRK